MPSFWKWNFPISPSVRRSVCQNFLEGRKVSLPCSYWNTHYISTLPHHSPIDRRRFIVSRLRRCLLRRRRRSDSVGGSRRDPCQFRRVAAAFLLTRSTDQVSVTRFWTTASHFDFVFFPPLFPSFYLYHKFVLTLTSSVSNIFIYFMSRNICSYIHPREIREIDERGRKKSACVCTELEFLVCGGVSI